MKKVLLIILIVIIAGLIAFLWASGVFTKIEIVEKTAGPYVLVYEDYIGAYKNVGPVMEKVYQSLKNDKIEVLKGFGIYYDDPKQVAEEKLRSQVGCILEEKDYKKVNQLRTKYRIKSFNKQNCLVVEFPYYTPFAIIAGIMKVYPALDKYSKENKIRYHEIMEVYDVPAKKIFYIMPK